MKPLPSIEKMILNSLLHVATLGSGVKGIKGILKGSVEQLGYMDSEVETGTCFLKLWKASA